MPLIRSAKYDHSSSFTVIRGLSWKVYQSHPWYQNVWIGPVLNGCKPEEIWDFLSITEHIISFPIRPPEVTAGEISYEWGEIVDFSRLWSISLSIHHWEVLCIFIQKDWIKYMLRLTEITFEFKSFDRLVCLVYVDELQVVKNPKTWINRSNDNKVLCWNYHQSIFSDFIPVNYCNTFLIPHPFMRK